MVQWRIWWGKLMKSNDTMKEQQKNIKESWWTQIEIGDENWWNPMITCTIGEENFGEPKNLL